MLVRLVLVSALGLSGATLARAQSSASGAERATLVVTGTGEVSRPPDTAQISLSLETRGPTLDGTTRDHRLRVAQAAPVLDRLKAAGFTVDEGSFSLSVERAAAAPAAHPGDDRPTYRASTRYDLTVRSLAGLDARVADVVGAGLFEIGSVRFSVADERTVLDDARRAAMEDARHQAQVYADAGEVRLDGIDRIVDGQAASRGEALYDLPLWKARAASVGIVPPKTLSFSGSIGVTWHIVPR